MKKLINYNTWYDCSDEYYWAEEYSSEFHTLISIKQTYWDDKNDKPLIEYYFFTRHDCPYGWNALISMGAKFMVVQNPIFNN